LTGALYLNTTHK